MNKISILELDSQECDILIDDLKNLDSEIGNRIDFIVSNASVTKQEALDYAVTESPILWAKVYLNWTPRDYQEPILLEGQASKLLVLRLGRRLGKTDSMCILIWWYAYTQFNKRQDDQYNILILAPYETQIDLIFTRLKQLLIRSPLLQTMVTRDIEHCYELSNGTIITGLTAGASGGSNGGNNTRGQRADLVVIDEVDYVGSSQLTNIINIRNEAPESIRIIAASTPCGKHEEFYKWCTHASRRYTVKKDDIDNFRFTGYATESAKEKGIKGNGWTEIYAPSTVNKELLKINPDTGVSYLEDIKNELTDTRYNQEVMAEFGDEELGVYQKKFIEAAISEGVLCNHKYIDINNEDEIMEFLRKHKGPVVMGVDWDRFKAGSNIVCLYLDKQHKNKHDIIEPKFKVFYREEIPRSEFTFTNGVDRIVELNDIFDFDWIAIDRGYGDTQIELLHKYGINNPRSGLAEKVVGYQFSQKLEVIDPYTHKKEKMLLKPFLVNNSVITFERMKIVLNQKDTSLIEQLESYRIKSFSSAGLPIYTDDNEHILDAMNLCLLIIEQKYGSLFKSVISSKILSISQIDRKNENVLNRSTQANIQAKSTIVGIRNRSKTKSYKAKVIVSNSSLPKRSSF